MKFFLSRSVASGLAATSALALVLGALPARADDADGGDNAEPGVARLSVMRGDVELKRADSGDTVAAAINAPVSAGDYVTTRDDSRVEIEYGFGSALRVAPDTQLRFTHLDPGNHALQLAQGTVEMRVFRGLDAHPEVDTPSATIRPDERGQYRITVTNDGNTEVTVRSGHADVITESGTQTIAPDGTLLVEGSGNDVRFRTIETVATDDFDAWNAERDTAFERVHNYEYVDQGIVGADDLDQYGHWVDNPTYGSVWAPDEPVGWAPYHDGSWVWEPYYGWTWIGAEPWGYAPYHYGNWFYADSGWFWCPGPYAYARPYRPALVAFLSFGLGGGGFGVGFGNIGWVPLAPFEPFRPWWGRGFGGRTTIVNNITIRNVTINNYYNLRAPNSVAAVTNTNFENGNFKHLTSVRAPELKTLTALRGGVLPIVPTQHNLVLNPSAKAPIAAAPLSARFAAFHSTASARPPSFVAQRETVAATAQKLYPEHAGGFAVEAAAAKNTQSSTERGIGTERAATTPERSVVPETSAARTNDEATPVEHGNGPRDPWSRFGDNGASSEGNRTSSEHGSTPVTTTPGTTRNTSTSGANRPSYASGDTSGSAWRRFGSDGSSTTGSTTRTGGSNAYGANSSSNGSRYGGGSRYDDSGSGSYHGAPSYRQSPTSSYHAPASSYHAPSPSYHAPASSYHAPASSYHAPTYHAPAPSAAGGSGGSHAHSSPGSSSGGSKDDSHKGH